jgi:hypothetical protein
MKFDQVNGLVRCIPLVALGLVLGSCGKPKSGKEPDSNTAKLSDQRQADIDYLKKHPAGFLAGRARARLADNDFLAEQSRRLGELVIAMAPKPVFGPAETSASATKLRFADTFSDPVKRFIGCGSSGQTESALADLQKLLEEGGDPNGVFVSGYTPFRTDLNGNDLGSLGTATLDRKNGPTVSLSDYCQKNKLAEVAKLLAQHRPGVFEPATAARRGDIAGLQRWLTERGPESGKSGAARGALMLAVRNGYPEIAKLLLAQGADPLALDSQGGTPLLEAAARDDSELTQMLLARIGADENSSYLSAAPAKELTGQNLLAKIAVEDGNSSVREAAVAKITDPAALATVAAASKDQRVREVAAAMLRVGLSSDQAAGIRNAVFKRDPTDRCAAIAGLTDQMSLAMIVAEDKDPAVRRAAVGKLSDQTVLKQVALEDTDIEIRRAAVEQLSDQAAIALIALGNADWSIRCSAVRKITDQALVASIAAEDKDPGVRRLAGVLLAVSKLADQAALAQAAIADPDLEVCRMAVERLTDQPLLAKVAGEAPNWFVRSTALAKVADQAILARIALEQKDYLLRRAATEKITDQAILARIALEDKEAWVRRVAVEKLTDQASLRKVLVDEEQRSVRDAAAKLIKEMENRDYELKHPRG